LVFVSIPSLPAASQTDHVSRVPGLKFGFTGNQVAITFGPNTIDTTLIAYRVDGQDWQFTNVSTGATHLLVSSNTVGVNLTYPINPSTFEMRGTNWAYGVQIASVHVGQGEKLVKVPDFPRTLEVIGDSLTAGQYGTLEGLSSYGYGLGAGLGNTEYSVTAYPGICLFDKLCWGNPHGMLYQWFRTSDTSSRAEKLYGNNPEWWDFSKKPAADIVVINLGTNDNNSANNVTADGFVAQYKMLVEGVHKVYPRAQIILMVSYSSMISSHKLMIESLFGKALAASAIHMCNPH
jgi:lysophospholipase L1-like esterase